MGNLIINDNLFLRQYEVEIEDDLAIIEYALQDRKIFLTKLIIPYSNKDENFEEKFIREVFEGKQSLSLLIYVVLRAKFYFFTSFPSLFSMEAIFDSNLPDFPSR